MAPPDAVAIDLVILADVPMIGVLAPPGWEDAVEARGCTILMHATQMEAAIAHHNDFSSSISVGATVCTPVETVDGGTTPASMIVAHSIAVRLCVPEALATTAPVEAATTSTPHYEDHLLVVVLNSMKMIRYSYPQAVYHLKVVTVARSQAGMKHVVVVLRLVPGTGMLVEEFVVLASVV